jgi:signal transduction histidine kinase
MDGHIHLTVNDNGIGLDKAARTDSGLAQWRKPSKRLIPGL